MVKQEVLLECLALCVASLIAMSTVFGDMTLMHPMAGGGLFLQDYDAPDTTIISASPFGGRFLQSVDLGDSIYSLGGGIGQAYRAPYMNSGMRIVPSYQPRRSSYPLSRRYGRSRSRRMRLVPV